MKKKYILNRSIKGTSIWRPFLFPVSSDFLEKRRKLPKFAWKSGRISRKPLGKTEKIAQISLEKRKNYGWRYL